MTTSTPALAIPLRLRAKCTLLASRDNYLFIYLLMATLSSTSNIINTVKDHSMA